MSLEDNPNQPNIDLRKEGQEKQRGVGAAFIVAVSGMLFTSYLALALISQLDTRVESLVIENRITIAIGILTISLLAGLVMLVPGVRRWLQGAPALVRGGLMIFVGLPIIIGIL